VKRLEQVVIIGASLAGLRAAEAMRSEGYAGRIRIVGDEPHAPYNRPPLSKKALSGAHDLQTLEFPLEASLDAEWHLGTPAVSLDTSAQQVHLANGERLGYDRLLVATGVRARWPAIFMPGQRVSALRTLDDAKRLAKGLTTSRKVLVIGAGFIGCEVAASIRSLGIRVALIDLATAPLVQAIGHMPAGLLGDRHEAEGVEMHLGAVVTEVLGDPDAPRGVRLSTGLVVHGDFVVVGIGSQPNVEWLAGSGVTTDDGVVCNSALEARGVANVWAAGDVLRWPHPALGGAYTRVEHWTHAAMSGMTAGRNMVDGGPGQPYDALPEFWSDQYDLNIRGVGRTGDRYEFELVSGDASGPWVGVYRDEGRVVGALASNATKQLARWRREVLSASAI
jgi:NADPH-dependent 2,4-dienoyl-CoA reductase/sulfur reductase-like enzyme